MRELWTRHWEEYRHGEERDSKMADLIDDLLNDIADSRKRLGSATPLREALDGWCARRIRGEHRLVYRVSGTGKDAHVEIAQCRYHS
jgi:toxin YoeB